MIVLELFSGTASFSKVARKMEWKTFTVDNDPKFKPDLVEDVLNLRLEQLPGNINIIWASPPCQTFSVMTITRYWNKGEPLNEECRNGLRILDKTIQLIKQINPEIWFIENPMGIMRKKIDHYFAKHNIIDYTRHKVTYCQYGFLSQKPTDIWTNLFSWKPKASCSKGDLCHIPASKGTKTQGTQGKSGSVERGKLPPALMWEIIRTIKYEPIKTESIKITDFFKGVKT